MKVPEEIKVAAKSLIDEYGCRFSYLGERNGVTYYLFLFPEGDDLSIGYPFVFEYKDGEAHEHNGFESFDIINLFDKNVREICVE